MSYQWFRGALLIVSGFSILGICKRADRLDPSSPDFAGSDAINALDGTLTEEEQKRKDSRT